LCEVFAFEYCIGDSDGISTAKAYNADGPFAGRSGYGYYGIGEVKHGVAKIGAMGEVTMGQPCRPSARFDNFEKKLSNLSTDFAPTNHHIKININCASCCNGQYSTKRQRELDKFMILLHHYACSYTESIVGEGDDK
jgi:hypothetical protein